jgi:hypothetical protein
MLPSKAKLSRGKKSVLMNFLKGEPLGKDMIACVDADYDYLMAGATPTSKSIIESPYVFHTYVYAIENFQCYAPSLHNVCVAVALNDHRIFDFRDYFRQFSEAIFPLFVWSVMVYRNGNYPKFTITDFNRIADPGGFNINIPAPSIAKVKRKVFTKINELQRLYPDAKEEYLATKESVKALGVTPESVLNFYMQAVATVVPVSPRMSRRYFIQALTTAITWKSSRLLSVSTNARKPLSMTRLFALQDPLRERLLPCWDWPSNQIRMICVNRQPWLLSRNYWTMELSFVYSTP